MRNVLKRKMFRAAAVMLCGAGLVVSAAVAQQDAPPAPADGQQQGMPMRGHGGMDPEHRVEMMQKRLDLNADQTTQLKAIMLDGQSKMEALRSNASLAPADRHTQMMALHQDEMAKVRGLLTPEQQTKFDAMLAKMRERHADGKGRMGGEATPPPPSQM